MSDQPRTYLKRPVKVQAVRYGDEETGAWVPGAVQRIANFMKGQPLDTPITDGECTDEVQPTALWDPPENAAVMIHDDVVHLSWLPLQPGQYVIKGVQGEFYPCDAEVFRRTYDEVLIDRGGAKA